MSKKDTKYQQQILFEEIPKTADESRVDKELITSQVVVDDDSWQLDDNPQEAETLHEAKKSRPRWLLRGLSILLPILVGIELVDFLVEGFQHSPIITSLYSAILFIVLAVVGRIGFKEYLGLRQLKRNGVLKQNIARLIKEEKSEAVIQACEKVHERLPCDLSVEFEDKWQKTAKNELNAGEIVELYDQQVLSVVDKKALDIIAKYSTESVVLVAVSPVAIIDMALMFWRNVRMLDDLAQLYGIRLSYWSRIRLIKQVFVNMAYAGASELVADVGIEVLGADLLGKISARFAQGMGAGMLTARLGLRALQACRPIDFSQNTPKLSAVRKAIAGRLAQIK